MFKKQLSTLNEQHLPLAHCALLIATFRESDQVENEMFMEQLPKIE